VSIAPVGLDPQSIVQPVGRASRFDPLMTRTLHLGICVLLMGVSFLAYRGALDNDLVWDSTTYLMENPNILTLDWESLKWMLTTSFFYNWHPVTWVSYTIDNMIYGVRNPYGLHLTNILLHGINGLLVYLLGLKLFALHGARFGLDDRRWVIAAAGLSALLFAVHPQHVESVAWVAERKDTLFLAFTLIAIWAYLQYATARSGGGYYYGLALLGFALALGSKSMPVTLPALLLILDAYPLGRVAKLTPRRVLRLLVEKIPFGLLSLGVALLTITAQRPANHMLASVSLDSRILVAADSLIRYVQKLILPLHFSPMYPHPGELPWTLQTVFPILALAAATVVCVWLWRRGQHFWLAGWVFYLLAMLPASGVIQVGIQAMADRYAYFPTLPFYYWIGGGLATWIVLRQDLGRANRAAIVAATAASCVGLVMLTVKQTEVWQDQVTLFSQMAYSNPRLPYAHENLAIAYLNRGNLDPAIEHFYQAAEAGGMMTRAVPAFGLALMHAKRYPQALNIYRQLIDSEAESGVSIDCIWFNVGIAFARIEDADQSVWALGQVDPESRSGPGAARLIEQLQSQGLEGLVFPDLCDQAPGAG
jgi:hypothetical protein